MRLENALKYSAKLDQNRAAMAGSGTVYLIQCGNHPLFKIGVATELSNRLSIMQVNCPFKLSIIASKLSPHPYELEKQLHYIVDEHRVRGEWFKLTRKSLDAVLIGFR